MEKLGYLRKSKPDNSVNGGDVGEAFRALNELSAALARALEAAGAFKMLEAVRLPNVKGAIDFYEEVRRFEIALILRALEYSGGSQVRAARLLRLAPTTLNAKIKTYDLGLKRAGARRAESGSVLAMYEEGTARKY